MINKFYLTLIFILIQFACSAQNPSDLQLIFSHSQNPKKIESVPSRHKRVVPYLFKPGFLVFKHGIYNQMGLTCIYDRPCLEFCGDLIEKFGLIKGYFLSFDRMVRCNRLTPLETYPSSLTTRGKIIDSISDYHN